MTLRMRRCLRSKLTMWTKIAIHSRWISRPSAERLVRGEGAETDGTERRRQPAFQPGPAITLARPGAPARQAPPLLRPHGSCSSATSRSYSRRSWCSSSSSFSHFSRATASQPDPSPTRPPAIVTPAIDQRRIHVSTAREQRAADSTGRARFSRSRSRSSAIPAAEASRARRLARWPDSSAAVTTSTGRGR